MTHEHKKDAIVISRSTLLRMLTSLLAAELSSSRQQDIFRLRPDRWTEDTLLLDMGLALDSLERMNCASSINELFHLSEYGAEDYLLAAEKLGDWIDVIDVSIRNGSGRLSFRTSGSTGTPKLCTHRFTDLVEEAEVWADLFRDRGSFLSMVPAHHIYGFIFTGILAERMGLPVVDGRFLGAAKLTETLQSADPLVIAAPSHWQYLARSVLTFPDNVVGVSSSAQMPAQLATRLKAQGLNKLVEVYGSSETAGVGYRSDHREPYQTLPYWMLREASPGNHAIRRTRTGEAIELMDCIEILADHYFHLTARKDGAVQVGGNNVFPSQTEAVLRAMPGVADCHVRFCEQSRRLKAYVIPADESEDPFVLEDRLRNSCRESLSTPQTPTSFTFGPKLPLGPLGKVANW